MVISLWTSDFLHGYRYIVCQGLRGDSDPVRQYMHEINLDLNRLGVSSSTQDVRHIVPMDMLHADQSFFNYIYESNVEWVSWFPMSWFYICFMYIYYNRFHAYIDLDGSLFQFR